MERGRVAGGIERGGVDDVVLVDVALLEGDEVIAPGFADGTAELEAVTPPAGWRGDRGEGIGGVEGAFAVGEKERAVDGVGAGFGEDLHPAAGVGGSVVLRGEQVGRGHDAGDGSLGRQSARVLKAIDSDAGGAGSAAVGSGENLQLAPEVVGIVGELANFLWRQRVRADALIGIEADGVVGGHFDIGSYDGEGEMEVESSGGAGADLNLSIRGFEAGRGDGNPVGAAGEAGEPILSGGAGSEGRDAIDANGRVRNHGAGGVGNDAFDGTAGAGLRQGGDGEEQEEQHDDGGDGGMAHTEPFRYRHGVRTERVKPVPVVSNAQ